MEIKNICVYCSSSNSLEDFFYQEARTLGQAIGTNNWGLVYGGTHIGLMGEVARAADGHGAKVTGVIPRHIHSKGLANTACSQLIVTHDMSERKKTMIQLSDAFIALPGGFGTLEEIMEVITLKQLQLISKPVVFINTAGFYNNLNIFFESLFSRRFTAEKFRQLYFMADSANEAADYILNYRPPAITDKWTV